jgi:hypothetical protein
MDNGKNQTMSLIEFITSIDQPPVETMCSDPPQNNDSKLILCISHILRDTCEFNTSCSVLSNFDHKSDKVPSISIEKYLTKHIIRYMKVPVDYIIMSMALIDRIGKKHGILVTKRNVHRLLIIAVTEIMKMYDDKYYSNLYCSKVGGLPIGEFNYLECIFLKLLDFNVYVHEDITLEYKKHLLSITKKS